MKHNFKIGDIAMWKGHEVKVKDIFVDELEDGSIEVFYTIAPTGNYGFPIEVADSSEGWGVTED